MTTNDKIPDRINISKDARGLINKIDDSKFCGLNNGSAARSELYLFAMALGIDVGGPEPFSVAGQEGFVLDKSIDARTKALMIALSIYDSHATDFEALEHATNKATVYSLSDEYANAGFIVLKDVVENSKGDDKFLWDTLAEIDEMYKSLYS